MQLYKIATDAESFHDQWYLKQDGSVPYSHFDLPDEFDPKVTCARCLESENGEEWIEIPIWKQWYHDGCF